jgi:hypothetical protein
MSILQEKKRDLQGLWGCCREDVAYTDLGKVYLMDGYRPVIGDPECPEESTRTVWLVPINMNGKEEYRGRAVFFPVYRNGLIDPNALNYQHRKQQAVADAMEFLKLRDDGREG